MKKNYYGFDHKKINDKFTGGLTYINDVCVNGEYNPVAVYKADNPDTTKGHKKYLLLQTTSRGGLVRGMTPEEIEPFRYQEGVICHVCQDVLYSVYRHDYRSCTCGNVSIDGGPGYTRIIPKSEEYTCVTLDLIWNLYI